MNRTLLVTLTDAELLELSGILLGRDETAALHFLDEYLKKPANEALQDG